jgi:hypothetical protein
MLKSLKESAIGAAWVTVVLLVLLRIFEKVYP